MDLHQEICSQLLSDFERDKNHDQGDMCNPPLPMLVSLTNAEPDPGSSRDGVGQLNTSVQLASIVVSTKDDRSACATVRSWGASPACAHGRLA